MYCDPIWPWSRGQRAADPLRCPACFRTYLHHDCITVYQREQEDAEQLIKTTVGVSVETVRAEGSGNPSSRRDGLVIAFWCEDCDARPELEIAQEAGETFVAWRT
jgi:hypothetical protein